MTDFSVKMKAVETSNFIRLLPILLGDFVPEDDPVWGILINFVRLVQLQLSPVFNGEECQLLADLTEEFLSSFYSHFGDVNVKPKSHFLVHYPTQILETGPPVDHDTVRFEGKHNHFKEVYNRSKNRVNIVKTLAKRHQFYMYLHYRNQNLLTPDAPTTTGSELVSLDKISDSEMKRVMTQCLSGESMINLHSMVKMEGIIYAQGTAVVLSFLDDTFQFGCIQHCFFRGQTLYLFCQIMSTTHFNQHYNSYEVAFTENFEVFKVSDLLDINPVGLYQVRGLPNSWLVPLKHYLRIPDEENV